MKKTFTLLSLLIALVLMLNLPVKAAGDSFIDNARWHETTRSAIQNKYDNNQSFIVVFYRQDCFNSNIRRILLDEWMDTYHIDIYGVDFDDDNMPRWVWEPLGNSCTLPVIAIVDKGNAAVYDGNSSMRVINQAVLEFMGVYDGQEVDYYKANNAVYSKYANDRYTAEKLYLKSASSISSEIVSQAQSVTAGLSTDRAKVKAIYDWVAENVYYDYGMLEGYIPYYVTAEETYARRMTVCAGYANLVLDMCNAVGIPCRVVSGFATGVGTDTSASAVWTIYKQYLSSGNLSALRSGVAQYENHAWNEAYVNGKWLILDATWGSNNDAYYNSQSGSYGLISAAHSDEFFDPSLEHFSETHLFLQDRSTVYPKVTSHPASVKTKAGQTASFTVTASGSGLKYQWQWRTGSSGSWTNSTSATTGYNTATLKVSATTARNGYQYRCKITNSAGYTVYSNAATLNVVGITSQPASVNTSAGNTATFKVTAVGSGLTYQWQWRANSSGSWTNSTSATTGYNTATLKVSATTARNGYQYRCMVKDSAGNTVYSNAATLKVSRITSQPASVNTAAGNTATFKVVASGSGLTYQWQWRAGSSGSWTNSTSATTGYNTATLKVSATTARNGYQYRCRVKDSTGNTEYSNAATLHVLGVTTQPSSVNTIAGNTAAFNVAAVGSGLTYQWQWRANSSDSWTNSTSATTGYNTAALRVSATTARNGYQYRCRVKDSAGNTVYSNVATLYVMWINSQTTYVRTSVGATATFKVNATGNGLTYQWQWRANPSGTWTNSTSATTGYNTATLWVAATTARNGYQYRCRVRDAAGNTLYSDPADLIVD